LSSTLALLIAGAIGSLTAAANPAQRPASPHGASAVEVGGHYDRQGRYVEGHWIEMRYGRPIRRARDLFGPDDFVEFLNDGAEVWRAGANVSTQLITEVPLWIADIEIPTGSYTLFVELSRERWTLIVSRWPAQQSYDYENHDALFGAYGFTPDRDVVRVTMDLEELDHSFEQLSWQFLDMTASGGRLALMWESKLASVPFRLETP
jgi:hypothetical protein